MIAARKMTNAVAVGFAMLMIAACTSRMAPAQRALDDIDAAMSAATADASKYLPDQLAELKKRRSDLNGRFEAKDYAGVLSSAPGVLSTAQQLATAAATKKEEALNSERVEWMKLDTALPRMLAMVKKRVDAESRLRHARRGLNLSAAKSSYENATALWQNALTSYKAGNVEDAVSTARAVETKAEAAAAELKFKLPETVT